MPQNKIFGKSRLIPRCQYQSRMYVRVLPLTRRRQTWNHLDHLITRGAWRLNLPLQSIPRLPSSTRPTSSRIRTLKARSWEMLWDSKIRNELRSHGGPQKTFHPRKLEKTTKKRWLRSKWSTTRSLIARIRVRGTNKTVWPRNRRLHKRDTTSLFQVKLTILWIFHKRSRTIKIIKDKNNTS